MLPGFILVIVNPSQLPSHQPFFSLGLVMGAAPVAHRTQAPAVSCGQLDFPSSWLWMSGMGPLDGEIATNPKLPKHKTVTSFQS
jgi:hypothetical protein